MSTKDDDTPRAVILPLGPADRPGEFVGAAIDDDGTHRIVKFSPVEEGKPIMGRYVEATPRPGTPFLDATYPLERRSTRSGPARVNSAAYRDGWDRIFGQKPEGEA